VLPTKGGIVVDMSLFNQVKDIDETNLTVTVQSGAVWQDVDKKLNENGLSLRVMPTSSPSSTAGGWFAQGGAGLRSFASGGSTAHSKNDRVHEGALMRLPVYFCTLLC
jgi:FAD/FMN-containing dehydrogenase